MLFEIYVVGDIGVILYYFVLSRGVGVGYVGYWDIFGFYKVEKISWLIVYEVFVFEIYCMGDRCLIWLEMGVWECVDGGWLFVWNLEILFIDFF